MAPPGPIPLADKEQQKEIDELIRRGGVSEAQLSEEEMEGELENLRHRDAEKEPLLPFENDVNPKTGEKGGPKGPEPTRYGDWERKVRLFCCGCWKEGAIGSGLKLTELL